jgi:hypothetical protein
MTGPDARKGLVQIKYTLNVLPYNPKIPVQSAKI